jgi:hypothetical protein
MSALMTGRRRQAALAASLSGVSRVTVAKLNTSGMKRSKQGLGVDKMGRCPFSAPYALAVDHSSGGTGLSFRLLAAFGVSSR